MHILLCAHSNVRVQLNSFKLRRMAVAMTIKMTLQDKLHGPTNVFRQRFHVYLCCGIFFWYAAVDLLIYKFCESEASAENAIEGLRFFASLTFTSAHQLFI